MATDKIQINEGTSGKYTGTYSFTEDTVTKNVGRVVLNKSDGTELGTNANPLQVGDGGGSITIDGTVTVANPTTNPETGLAKDASLLETHYSEDAAASSGVKGELILGIRQDSDTTPVSSDNDYHAFIFDEVGRLKVGTQPGSFPLVTSNITASAQTAFCDVSRASNVMISMVATTLVGHNSTFEGSIDSTNGTDGNWFGIQVIRSNANTIELTTGVLAATPAYAWEASANGLSFIRVRATAHTSGTATWKFQRGSYATEPIPAAQVSGTQPISGSLTSAGTTTATPANGTTYNVVTTASTNAAFMKASAGNLYEITVSNPTATAAYVKLYNKASAPTVGTDVPVMTIAIPATAAGVGEKSFNFGSVGKRFATGIAIAVTAAAAATDTANAVAGVQINATYI